ncbi:PilZ domain-containing protein [Paucidesulfovibrio gracilis DSM 16080]|jgi:hypothetical protein|uniref:PilZ domain-containing protein n=1 Tax=Paucidesulfovibrio gracilis DSM 16080 TaxID=1121449 RepID=A0A1T4X0D1_9BACT|nr:PilZ domain-containing protein [Paucidesulfovibrio gracilis]SKA83103.1 PilZ domain-containing protein [Paucidesulfovibrio gracilis DSM 16080]
MTQEATRRFEERRMHVRYECRRGAVCELALRTGPHDFAVEDISGGGMRINSKDPRTAEAFREDMPVRIMAGGTGATCPMDDLTGRVIWVRTDQGSVQVGIEFDEPLESKLDYYLEVFLNSETIPG